MTYLTRLSIFVPLLLLAVPCTAQWLLRDYNGNVVYENDIKLPDLTRAQVLSRATRYASAHLFTHDLRVVPLLVDSADQLVSAVQGWSGRRLTLRYELVLYVWPGGYRYHISDMATLVSVQGSPAVPEAGLYPSARYEAIELQLDRPSNYDAQHQARPALRAYRATLAAEVEAALAQLRTEMAKP